jgi:hypothetical protein
MARGELEPKQISLRVVRVEGRSVATNRHRFVVQVVVRI